jgi:opacity protein-like surface antigen
MRTLGILFLAVLAAQTAQAQVYFRADSGISFSEGVDFKDSDPNTFLICGNQACSQPGKLEDFGNAFIFSAGLGYRVGAHARADVVLGYRRYYLNMSDAGAPPAQFTANVQSLSAMLNAYIDFPSGAWVPFVGAGVGQAKNKIGTLSFDDGAGFQGNVAGGTHSGRAWAVMAGAGFPVAGGGTIEFGYRYVDLGKVETAAGASVMVNGVVVPPPYPGASGNLRAHELTIGVRF